MRSDNGQTYGTISRILHWSMALCFGFMLYTGLLDEESFRSLLPYHKSVGTILMVLIILRVIWAKINRKNRPQPSNIFVVLGHSVLYLLMVLVPLTALIRQYGGARGPLEVFGVKVMDDAAQKIEWMTSIGNSLHGTLAWALFVLAAGHIIMAIYHQIKGEKILNRMMH
ncbi:cytochrome b [Mannheimia sp. AT1]|uniref:Cytochrome b n=1 Tax=Mannheimia cairinae TaxID=3025936 RepID=A0ABT5MQ51_9PAST|nr:cytochrome b [Mannheimia cairinae]MDD0824117.1 cytochrome b [Mannheimia cairinae]MDD0826822.1 cytochrome b [Mannheimia cairinae]